MKLNRKKLATISVFPLFGLCLWAFEVQDPRVSDSYFAARIDDAEQQYAKNNRTTVEKIVLESRQQCEARLPECLIEKRQEQDKAPGGILDINPDLLCTCFRPIIALPENTFRSHAAGLVGGLHSLTPILLTLILAVAVSFLSFLVLPVLITRFWAWLHI